MYGTRIMCCSVGDRCMPADLSLSTILKKEMECNANAICNN
jgi:hypothetical protein